MFLLSVLTACGPIGLEPNSAGHHMDGAEDTAPAEPACVGDTGVPVALCSASSDTVAAAVERVLLSADGSYDPSGCRLAGYTWLVSAPTGSEARPDGESLATFFPDVVGRYEVQLLVGDVDGQVSDPCSVAIEAIPAGDLVIEMWWTRSGDDMDLHLLRPDGALESNGDCYYANCTRGLDWGGRGASSDDPELVLDDISGTGPEGINIDSPADGVYTVYVHDYPGSVYEGSNRVTVNIYANGTAWSATIDIDEEDAYVPFATITFPGGVVTSL